MNDQPPIAEVQRLEAELRAFTVLRDNFHDLYREERDARAAAERQVEAVIAERDRLHAEVGMLHAQLHSVRETLARTQRQPAARTVELRGQPTPAWKPRILEGC
ncbi:MAG TPA: hypothetical protein VN193_16890 [Candidatus Angelobacter sp.]|jgi:hypothetical protein|nr:hypothetical protein [Candidatus Angelobacter sp.]